MHHQDDPADARLDQLARRLSVAGDLRPVVWRAERPQHPGCLSPQLSRSLLAEYTRVGEIVVDVDDDADFATTAGQMGRRHHALGGAQHLPSMRHAAGYLDLILLHWPRT